MPCKQHKKMRPLGNACTNHTNTKENCTTVFAWVISYITLALNVVHLSKLTRVMDIITTHCRFLLEHSSQ